MAKMLYRLGLLATRRAKTVIAAWFALLVLAVSAFLGFGGQLTDQITMPDLETTEVADRLAEEMPDAGGGSASVVLRTDDGSSFTEEQEAGVAQLIEEVEQHEAVDSATDPFVSQEEMAESQEELTEGREELEEGSQEIEEGWEELEQAREELDAGQAELDEGQAQLDQAIEEAQAGGYYEALAPQFEYQQGELDVAQSELDGARAEIEEGEAELEAAEEDVAPAEAELDRGEAMLSLSEDLGMVSDDGDIAVMMVSFHESMENVGMEELSSLDEDLTAAEIDGVEVLPSQDISMEMPHLFSTAEAIGLMVAAAVLLIMLGTLIGAGLPLFNALIGVGIGVAGAMALSGTVEMMSITPILGLMLGLAVGIDYALFILHRHRNQLKDGVGTRESIALANGTAGNAVVFAGATVVIALLALNVTGLPFLGLMGTVAAVCVIIAVLMATTMTPALLSLVGRRILRRKERRYIGFHESKKITTPIGGLKALGIAAVSLVGLGLLAVPTFDMRLGLPDAGSQAEDSTAYQAYSATEEAFGQGMNGPLLVVADLNDDLSEDQATDYQIEIGTALAARDDIEAAVPVGVNDENSVAVFQVLPVEGPAAESTESLVHEFRDGEPLSDAQAEADGVSLSGVELSVAGMTAANIDISDVISDALPLYLALVVGLSLVLMVIVFRSILLPVVATLGFVGSFAAAMGIVVAIFQWGWMGDLFGLSEPGPIVTFLPVIMVGILFGLAMDYQLFTASGMREAYAHGSAPRVAVRQGLHAGRSVVTAAALIMGSVFAGFIFTDDPMVASIGLGLAGGVLLDAFVVRLLLVPAVLTLLGPAAWWLPKWLDKILPDVDVEGAALERQVAEGSEEDAEEAAEQKEAEQKEAGQEAEGAKADGRRRRSRRDEEALSSSRS